MKPEEIKGMYISSDYNDEWELVVMPTPLVREPEIFYPLGWEKDGQAKRRERRKNRVKDKSRWHIK